MSGWWFGSILFLIIWVAIAFWPARVAGRKGHSFFGYFLFSLVFFPAALIVAYMVQDTESHGVTQAISEPRPSSSPGGLSRRRRIAARTLTVVAILLALVGMIAYYVAHTALDQTGFKTISRNMIEDDAIRTQVANAAVDGLYDNVDVQAAIAARLPPAQKGLAPVLAGLSRSGAYRAAEAALERPRAQNAWIETTTATQQQLVKLLDNKSTFTHTENGTVVLDLRPIMIQIGDQVVVIGRVADKLPDSAGKIAIVDANQLQTVQTLTRILRAVANWMWLLALAVAAAAVWLAHGRRRIELRALAIGLLLVGLLMLVVRRAGGGYLIDHLAKDDSVKPAAHNAWNILSQTLADRAWVWITLGAVLLLGVWFVGNTNPALRARRAARPFLQNRLTTYGIAAITLLILALIAPLFARGWIMATVTIALTIVGVETIRAIVQREAPKPT